MWRRAKARGALLMANPEILWRSEETFTYKEGCLSIPDQFGRNYRAKRVKVGFYRT